MDANDWIGYPFPDGRRCAMPALQSVDVRYVAAAAERLRAGLIGELALPTAHALIS
jgi:hypothetical protein